MVPALPTFAFELLRSPPVISGMIVLAAACFVLLLQWRVYKRRRFIWQLELQIREGEWQQSLVRLEEQRDRLETELAEARLELKTKERAFQSLELNFKVQGVRMDELQKQLNAEKEQLTRQSTLLAKEFELLANRLFDAKQEQFTRVAKSNLEQIISPFQNQLKDFYQRVDHAQRSDLAQRNQLLGEISALQKQSQQISADAANLANALKGNNKLMGSWGEIVLARLLEQSGLCKGREYEVQYSDTNRDGKRFQPDVVVHLPDQRDVVIDAKVSLVSFERHVNSDDEQARNSALRMHVESVRSHVKSLASKRYEDLLNIQCLDFVFMFVPVEAAFLIVAEQNPEVFDEAFKKNIIITSPSTLMVALKTVDALWQRKKQEQNVDDIVSSAGKLYDQFVRFAESLQEVGTGLSRAGEAYEAALRRLCDGRGNLVKRVEDLKSLGARTSKSMPASLSTRARHSHLTTIGVAPKQEEV